MQTTLNKIRAHNPCADGWKKLLASLGKTGADDAPLDLLTILDSNGAEDALWCLRAVHGCERDMRLLAVAFARRVQHLDETGTAKTTLDVVERYAHGQATEAELRAAIYAADAAKAARIGTYAARAADGAWAAEWAAGRVGELAAEAAEDAELDAELAAWDAEGDEWDAEGDAADAAWDAGAAEREAQARILRRYLTTGVISWEDE